MRFPPVPSLFFVALLAAPAFSQASPAAATPRIVFTFDHPQLQPSHYTLAFDENGAGQYSSQPGPASGAADGIFPTPLDRSMLVDDALRSTLFSWARAHSFFATQCASAQTNLAFTGNKTLAYTGSDGTGTCTFVWPADPALSRLVDQLQAVAFTLEEGRRLDLELRHDRLGLDAELSTLQDACKDHRALDVTNLADQLQAIASDRQVMDRARKKASAILTHCEAPQKHN